MIHLSQTNTNDFDQLVFQDRNQAYGAYALRKSYSSTMLKSFLIGVAFSASLLAAPYLSDLFKKEEMVPKKPTKTIVDVVTIEDDNDDDLPEIPKERKESSGPVESTIAFNAWAVTTNDVNDEPVTSDDLKDLQPGSFTQDGDPNNWGIPGEGDDGHKKIIGDDEDHVIPFGGLAEPPTYPGGEEAMWEFLGSNLEYPEHARQIHQEGKVYVTFVIDQFGNVTKVKVPRPIGGGLDEEAMRVVNMMPRWEPGKQNGRPVKVAFQLPIIFRLD